MHTLYNKYTGEIIGSLTCPDSLLQNQIEVLPEWQGLFEHAEASGDTHYYDLINTVRIRPEIIATPNKLQIAANGSDLFILSNLPVGCKITITDDIAETDDVIETVGEDGEIGFHTIFPGTYKVTAELWPYQPKEWEVTAS